VAPVCGPLSPKIEHGELCKLRKEARNGIDQFGFRGNVRNVVEIIQGEPLDERDEARAGGHQLLKLFDTQFETVVIIRVEMYGSEYVASAGEVERVIAGTVRDESPEVIE
jgi:hypothetical protein